MEKNSSTRIINLKARIKYNQTEQRGAWGFGGLLAVINGVVYIVAESKETTLFLSLPSFLIVSLLIYHHGKLQKEVEEYQSELDQLKKT